ncbi:MAG TPA: hypothetical protein VHL50_08195, partial [Pyrinomonadaceae bacterium]|nr:hypothetical protein [Pyrinomonadaceae bacterium]
MGEDARAKMNKLYSDSIVFDDIGVYALAPQLSYVSSSMIAADPGFWTFKPMAPTTSTVATKEPKK